MYGLYEIRILNTILFNIVVLTCSFVFALDCVALCTFFSVKVLAHLRLLSLLEPNRYISRTILVYLRCIDTGKYDGGYAKRSCRAVNYRNVL